MRISSCGLRTMGVVGASILCLNPVVPSATRIFVCALQMSWKGKSSGVFYLWDEFERGEHSECFVLQYNDYRVTDVSVGKDFTRMRFFSAKKDCTHNFPC